MSFGHASSSHRRWLIRWESEFDTCSDVEVLESLSDWVLHF